jgi:putative membrane protein
MGGSKAIGGPVIILAAILAVPAVSVAESRVMWPAVPEKANQEGLTIAQDAVGRIHQANDTEIEVGELAQRLGSSAEVRRYGRLLVADQARFERRVLDYARRRGITVDVPRVNSAEDERINQEGRAALGRLRALTGAAFDRQFLRFMIEYGQHAVQIVEDSGRDVDDPVLRRMLEKAVPILKQHLVIARSLTPRAAPAS